MTLVPATPRLTPAAIRAGREALGLTQEELARHLDVTVSTVNRWEQGRNVPMRRFRRLLAALFVGHNTGDA